MTLCTHHICAMCTMTALQHSFRIKDQMREQEQQRVPSMKSGLQEIKGKNYAGFRPCWCQFGIINTWLAST